jgi:hypothetical protein
MSLISETFLSVYYTKEIHNVCIFPEGTRFIDLSCGCDVVWACDDQGEVYMVIGPPHSIASSTFCPVWIKVDDKLQQKNGCNQNTSYRKNIFTKV